MSRAIQKQFPPRARHVKEALTVQPPRLVRVNFLVPENEREQIRQTAASFGLSMTEYFLRLHRITAAMVASSRRRKTKGGSLVRE